MKTIHDSSSIEPNENFEIKSEQTYISETSENRKFYSSNVNNTWGRFNGRFNELPLLLSKEAIKRVNTKIDFTKDKKKNLGQEMDIKFTSSGYYAILKVMKH